MDRMKTLLILSSILLAGCTPKGPGYRIHVANPVSISYEMHGASSEVIFGHAERYCNQWGKTSEFMYQLGGLVVAFRCFNPPNPNTEPCTRVDGCPYKMKQLYKLRLL
jgi:hypothetical protein